MQLILTNSEDGNQSAIRANLVEFLKNEKFVLSRRWDNWETNFSFTVKHSELHVAFDITVGRGYIAVGNDQGKRSERRTRIFNDADMVKALRIIKNRFDRHIRKDKKEERRRKEKRSEVQLITKKIIRRLRELDLPFNEEAAHDLSTYASVDVKYRNCEFTVHYNEMAHMVCAHIKIGGWGTAQSIEIGKVKQIFDVLAEE